jgi:ELWxxDGT repeat protein
VVFRGSLYFTQYDGPVNSGGRVRIWRSDGTAEGTVLATEVAGEELLNPAHLTLYSGALYFDAATSAQPSRRNLYKSDGTPGGTVMLRENLPVFEARVTGGKLYLRADRNYGADPELWVTDGTPAGTRQVTDFPTPPQYSKYEPGLPAATDGGILVFAAGTERHGIEPWRIAPDQAPPTPGTVVGRGVFYQGSPFGWNESDLASAAAATMAPDKRALLPGQTATFANVTTYSKGINGIVVDLPRVPRETAPTINDFSFRSGSGNGTWAADVPRPTLAFYPGAGAGGSDRVVLTWPDYNPRSLSPAAQAVANEWLEVSVRPNDRTGLALPDVFYFGNLVGDTGDRVGSAASVSLVDWVRTRGTVGSGAVGLNNPYDFDRNGRVSATDVAIARSNLLRTLRMFSAPASPAPPPPGSGGDDQTGWAQSLLAET